jgi:hypothetical protein
MAFIEQDGFRLSYEDTGGNAHAAVPARRRTWRVAGHGKPFRGFYPDIDDVSPERGQVARAGNSPYLYAAGVNCREHVTEMTLATDPR